MNETPVVEEPVVEEKPVTPPNLLDLIKARPNGPTQDILDGWKNKYGAIYASGFSEEELYVWRAITRNEYKKVQIENQKIANLKEDEQIDAQMASEERIVSMCLLWPVKTPEQLANGAGGTVPTLLEQILQQSNFVSPAQASQLVIKL